MLYLTKKFIISLIRTNIGGQVMRYLSILKEQIKLSLMSTAIFRANFILMLIQSIINSIIGVLAVDFIYLRVDSIAGWSKNEMIMLICTSLIVNQLYRGLINPNHLNFLRSVSIGSFDRVLIKPLNIIFQINTGRIDFSSFFSLIAPVIILCMQIKYLHFSISFPKIMLFLVFVFNGLILLTSFMMLLYSLEFIFIKVDGLTSIYYIVMSISEKPKEIFSNKFFLNSFSFIIPTIPLANIPVGILIGKTNVFEALSTLLSGGLFFLTAVLAIKFGIRRYSSASS